jgi:SAM-dependent methyltransferase
VIRDGRRPNSGPSGGPRLYAGRRARDAHRVPLEGLHRDRGRAESFGSIADAYDRYRSAYPRELVDRLVELRPAEVLDVGCGTGKAGLALARRGLAVLAVDPDPVMADVARRQGLPVEVARFEDWQDKGRRFDLIVCGHAWHWIDPTTGVARAGTLLRPGGTIARFWNFHVLPPDVLAGIDQAYQRHAPGLRAVGHDPDDGPDPDSFEGTPPFVRSETITYRWKRDMTADEWVGLIATFSDHQRLGVARLAALQEAVRQQIDSAGGRIQVHGGTYTRLATRN